MKSLILVLSFFILTALSFNVSASSKNDVPIRTVTTNQCANPDFDEVCDIGILTDSSGTIQDMSQTPDGTSNVIGINNTFWAALGDILNSAAAQANTSLGNQFAGTAIEISEPVAIGTGPHLTMKFSGGVNPGHISTTLTNFSPSVSVKLKTHGSPPLDTDYQCFFEVGIQPSQSLSAFYNFTTGIVTVTLNPTLQMTVSCDSSNPFDSGTIQNISAVLTNVINQALDNLPIINFNVPMDSGEGASATAYGFAGLSAALAGSYYVIDGVNEGNYISENLESIMTTGGSVTATLSTPPASIKSFGLTYVTLFNIDFSSLGVSFEAEMVYSVPETGPTQPNCPPANPACSAQY